MYRWVRGYVGTRLLKLSQPRKGCVSVGTWVRGYTAFETFLAGAYEPKISRWLRGHVGTRLFKLFWPGRCSHVVDMWVQGYTGFKTFLAWRIFTHDRGYMVHCFQTVLAGSG